MTATRRFHLPHPLVKRFAGLRQRHSITLAIEQLEAELLLQAADCRANRRMRAMQPGGGCMKAALGDHGVEVTQLLQSYSMHRIAFAVLGLIQAMPSAAAPLTVGMQRMCQYKRRRDGYRIEMWHQSGAARANHAITRDAISLRAAALDRRA